jgi:F420-dependent oxidoreductase-like protein
MRLRIFTEPQNGANYATLLHVARAAEEHGFDAFFRSDHYRVTSQGYSGLPGPTDSWVTLGALARETSRIRLGTLVTSSTFRLPGPLAVSVAQVDEMSGGRVELGLGTGWFGAEHAGYGIPFPPLRERFDRLEEQLEIITGLWETPPGRRFSYHGTYYRLEDSPALPKPVQRPRPPVIVGGWGRKRTPRLAARFADEFNIAFRPAGDTEAAFQRVRAACAELGRTRPMVFSAAQVVCCGLDDAELKNRADAIGGTPESLRERGLAGSPDELVEQIGRFAEAGAARIYLRLLDLTDLDHLELLATRVLPQV